MKLIDLLSSRSRVVVLSPHHDDFIWSLGGAIDSIGPEKITVINIFTTSNFIHNKTSTTRSPSEIRREENRIALENCGVTKNIDLGFKEALLRGYRPTNQFEWREDCSDAKIAKEILTRLSLTLKQYDQKDTILIAPLGLGEHVDHIITTKITRQLKFADILYYEDLPYAARLARTEFAKRFIRANELKRHTLQMPPKSVEKHIERYRLYKSQAIERHTTEIKSYLSKNGVVLWAKKL